MASLRKFVLLASFCNVLLTTVWHSYFLSKILDSVGIHDNRVKSEINLALTCWGFVNATTLALTVPRMKRRTAYLIGTISLLLIFVGWTIASARYAITEGQASSRAVIA